MNFKKLGAKLSMFDSLDISYACNKCGDIDKYTHGLPDHMTKQHGLRHGVGPRCYGKLIAVETTDCDCGKMATERRKADGALFCSACAYAQVDTAMQNG